MGLTVLFLIFFYVKRDIDASEMTLGTACKMRLVRELSDGVVHNFLPVISHMQQREQGNSPLLEGQIADVMSVYGYYREEMPAHNGIDGEHEAEQQNIEPQKEEQQIEELQIVEQTGANQPDTQEVSNAGEIMQEQSLQELLVAENEAALQRANSVFVPRQLQSPVDLLQFREYERLVETFYTIDANTMAGSEQLDVTKLTGKNMTISKEGEGPQILIYHTHSQEGFADSVPGDESTTIVGAGERLAEILIKEYGYEVLHHKGRYDVDVRDDAYGVSLPEIEKLLAENPSIQVVIDLHRDSMPEETKLVMDLDGRPTARFMFFNGLSRTRKTGNIDYLYNENLEDNLAFSFQLQVKAAEYYPGITRKIYLKGYRYNMHLRPRTTLVELGAQNNTVEEAMNACDPLAHIIDMVLSGE